MSHDEHIMCDAEIARLKMENKELLKMLTVISDLESIWMPDTININPNNYGELQALCVMAEKIKQLIKAKNDAVQPRFRSLRL